MTYRWEYPGSELEFDEQPEAEAWLSENWTDLAAAGVEHVSLVSDGTVVYGPMGLHPAE